MPHLIVKTVANVPTNAMTFARAKEFVARGIVSVNDPKKLTEAGEKIWAAIEDWNTRHAFHFHEKANTSISLVAGDSTYELPSDFMHVYDVRISGGNNWPLIYVPRWIRDKIQFNADSTFGGPPKYYDVFSQASTAQMTVFPPPETGTSDSLIVNYYRPISQPTRNDQILDLPQRWVYGPLYKAKELLAYDHDIDPRKVQGYAITAERWFMRARADDRKRTDALNRFVSKDEWAASPDDLRDVVMWED